MSTGRRTAKHKDGGGHGPRMETTGGVVLPDKRKFEKEKREIIERIREREDKIKPVPSNTTQQLGTEITKETGKLSELDKTRENRNAELKAVEAKIKEVGLKYSEKKRVASDLLAGVRHKTEGRHDDAVERLEQQMLMRRYSNSEERKFKQEVDALKKSKERLVEYLVAKSDVDTLKGELEALRNQRDDLHRYIKEHRTKELAVKDNIALLRQELDEAKERKKISMTERDELRKEIDSLQQRRRQLCDSFRAEQLAYLAATNKQTQLQREEENQRRVQNRVAREEHRRMRAVERDFHHEQQYEDNIATCRALVAHLHKLSLATHAPLDTDEDLAPSHATTTPLECAPLRAESNPSATPGGYILRRDKEEMLLVPSASSLTRKRSKKEKRRNTPIVKVSKGLQLNATIFKQFSTLSLVPPNTFSDIPQVIAQLNDRLSYFEGMIKKGSPSSLYLELDSGVGSTAPSEMLDVTDRDTEFTISQEDGILNLDPGLGAITPTSPKTSLVDIANHTIPDSDSCSLPVANGNVSKFEELSLACATSNESDSHDDTHLSPELVSVTSTSSCANGVQFPANEE